MKWTLKPKGRNGQSASDTSTESRNGADLNRMTEAVSKIGVSLNKVSLTRSVGVKLFLIIFISILVCVYAVGLYSYNTAKDIIQNKMMDSTKTAISQTAGKLNLQLSSMENLAMSFVLDQTLQMNSRELAYAANLSDFERYTNVQGIETSFNNFLFGNSRYIVGGALLPLKKELSPILSATSRLDVEQAVETEWYKRGVELDGTTFWIPTMKKGLNDSGTKMTFGLAKVIRSTATSEPIYLMVLEYDYQVLMEQFADVSLGEGSKVRIVGEDGTILFGAEEEIGEKLHLDLGQASEAEAVIADLDGATVLAPYQTILTGWTLVGTLPVGELVKDAGKIRNVMYGMLGIAALLAAGIGLLVIWMIAMPLAKLRNLMNEGEKGNLTVRSNIRKRDEIGQLALSFNQMMEQITALVNRTNESAAQVLQTAETLSEASRKTALSAKEIAVATEEIANGATSLAVEAERGSELTERMGAKMQEVNEARDQMASSAVEVERASEQGTRYMASLIEKTGMTEEMTRNMVEKVDRLKESTRSIRQILDVLNNITKQTNILSLNATIEAARAGAAGKGFMVVADEIRKLADQSRESIDVVASITESIQNEIEATVSVLGEAYPIFQEQIESVKEANQIFLSVQAQMNAFTAHLETVNESVAQLGQTQSVLSEAMGNVSAVAQQSSATSEEVASLSNEQLNISENLVALSGELEKVSNHLKETLTHFRTDDLKSKGGNS
jgi:Methyl-accepting chemotaxis protein